MLVAVACGIAGCSNGKSADDALAERIVFRSDDFPGWAKIGTRKIDCLRDARSRAVSAFARKDDGLAVTSVAEVFPNAEAASQRFVVLKRGLSSRCFEEGLLGLPDNAVGDSVERLFPGPGWLGNAGARSAAFGFRVNAHLFGGSTKELVTYYFDVVLVQKGRVAATIFFAAYNGPFPRDESALSRLIVNRIPPTG